MDKPSPSSSTCKNCKSNPCLKGKVVTFKIFVDGAYFRGMIGPNEFVIYGYTHKEGSGSKWGTEYQKKWIKKNTPNG